MLWLSGKLVKIVNGAYRGHDAVLEEINEKKFCCTVSIASVSTVKQSNSCDKFNRASAQMFTAGVHVYCV